jgi:DNA-binding NtrC family response regulator
VKRVLLVDEDSSRRAVLEGFFLDRVHRVCQAASLPQATMKVAEAGIDVVVLRAPLAGQSGPELLRAIHEVDSRMPVILVTSTGSTDEAIQATSLGAFDYVVEPFTNSELMAVVAQACEAHRLSSEPVEMALENGGPPSNDALVGRSRPMQEVYKAIGRVAPTDATVLIRGESGTGKELVARAIYQHSKRADRPFVVVNCVAIPETLLESELFGYERGAFTGAVNRKIGRIEQAAGGTIFLDEIGDMPLSIQAKILRLLQDRSIERLGGQESIDVDVRILAATNRDLEEAIAEERFRSDLFYRLSVVPIVLPPLRERRDDVPLLCAYFMARITRSLGVRNPGIDTDACEVLAAHDWPGNVRELANAIEQLLIFSRGQRIGPREVGEVLAPPGTGPGFDEAEQVVRSWVRLSVALGRPKLLSGILDEVTRSTLSEVLKLTGGNRTRAARLLGISRPTLLARMLKLGLR